MENLIKVDGLVKKYDEFTLDGVSLAVPAGCVVGLVGSNGAGKTTTLKAILGLIAPDAGTVELLGSRVDDDDAALACVKERIGVVFDTCPFTPESTIRDVGAIGRFAYSSWNSAAFSRLIAEFGLPEKKQVKDLSRGMGMKLQLAFALAHDPRLLVLDEATAGLDPIARDEVLDLLRGFMADGEQGGGRGILMSSHITTDLEKIADYVLCIDAGREVFSCPVDDICDVAGVVRCREGELVAMVESGLFAAGALRVIRGDYSVDVLVPDRGAVARRFPALACERATIDDYMRLMLKGEAR